mgnify:CR=1 FL=1
MTSQIQTEEARLNPQNGLSQLANGRYINLFDLQPEDITIEMIAHSISRLCRYNGQVAGFISVGMHSLRCMRAAFAAGRYDVALECLCHDFGEAFFGDLVRPLKNDPPMRDRYLAIETAGEIVIAKMLGFNYPFDPFVKEMDMLDSKLEMDSERFDPNRWDDIKQTEGDIIYWFNFLKERRDRCM